MRSLLHRAALAAFLAFGIAVPALAAPVNPGREWMLQKKNVKKVFVPDGPGSGDFQGGQARSDSKTLSGDTSKGAANARNAAAGKALALSGSTAATARGGAAAVDLAALAARLSAGPVDFGGSDGKRYFQVSTPGGQDTLFQFRAYHGESLGSTILVVTGRNPSASKGGVLVSITRTSRDGNTINGVFEGPNGKGSALKALN